MMRGWFAVVTMGALMLPSLAVAQDGANVDEGAAADDGTAAEDEAAAEDGAHGKEQAATGDQVAVRERALELGRAGIKLYNERRWVESLERFTRAETMVHSPVFVLYMGRAERRLGRWLAARDHFRAVASERLPEDAASAWKDALRDAQEELAALNTALPTLEIAVRANPRHRVEVWLDGVEIHADAYQRATIALDPGDHEIVARCDRERPVRQRVVLEEGARYRLPLQLPCAPPLAPTLPQPRFEEPLVDPGASQRVVGLVVIGVASGALLVGLGTGVAALSKDAELEEVCDASLECPASSRDDVEEYYAFAHTSTATMAIGGVGLLAGLITLWTTPSRPPPGRSHDAAVFTPSFGLGSAEVTVRF